MSTEGTEQDGTDDEQGAGPEGTIPASADGVAAGSTDEPSHFEPEEDDGDGS
ncbi:hypothetical protein [Arthrobacter agilis]|jgi:hypothetical protein|uniref:hypothetical protein n=1 Tax=Arthrobacter agilis TaxID=37921 RepID=UPI00277F66C6|nr:hypothetical protein [Arthrobacter agilis]MDQ0735384.1 hypothetical protein [Arthrobacter agilis]